MGLARGSTVGLEPAHLHRVREDGVVGWDGNVISHAHWMVMFIHTG